ncbi:hypothetical protein AB205_0135650 [Aquarana catesbeiana]|uniref:Endonuclease/exonuclease/phosphatase domain-containing protein n=1 Tax=Aquarana catesbeiana TaxID=8400 RepID=A0A2G9Q7C2_AQUCT|nr:hypothetical protein AB205_0135650 [Aquarana catesbeiana]
MTPIILMAVPTPIKVVTINVASIKSARVRDIALFLLSEFDAEILFLQETWLNTLADVHLAKREWRCGPSFWSLAAEPCSGVAVLFKTDMVKPVCWWVIEVEMGRWMVLDVSVRGQDLRLINIYGPQSKWGRKCLFTEIKPFIFTSQQVVFGGDFNTIIRPEDRRGSIDRLGYNSVFLRDMENSAFSAPELRALEFSDHCMLSVTLNASDTPPRGRGTWKLNSALLEDVEVVAYADDVSVIVSGTEEEQEVVSMIEQYTEASGSKVNHEK